MKTKRKALLSVSDKTGLLSFASGLITHGFELISTGGTAKALMDANLAVTEIEDYTGFPEMLDGRVKTLHPKVHGGILAKRDNDKHIKSVREHKIDLIDFVVVNLYPFERTVAQDNCTLETAIENIDIGGPTLIRAAAKNWRDVSVITTPEQYQNVLEELNENAGELSSDTRYNLAGAAFSHTAIYDGNISNYLTSRERKKEKKSFPSAFTMQFQKSSDLRYGENPHQKAAFYVSRNSHSGTFADHHLLQGKELSFNNLADADTAWDSVKSLPKPACAIIKHANPCGAAIADSAKKAYELAFATDPVSAFGGIIAFNVEIDEETAQRVTNKFVEVVIAPGFSDEAKKIFAKKPNVRALQIEKTNKENELDYKRIGGGLLVQTADIETPSLDQLKIVTKREPNSKQLKQMLFAWKIVKFVKSNAIVFVNNNMTLGIGAGQMSRVDSVKIATIKAQKSNLSLEQSIVASDAFFPFRDGIDLIADSGAAAIIQPGGSVKDNEIVTAANERKLIMAFTDIRHFRH